MATGSSITPVFTCNPVLGGKNKVVGLDGMYDAFQHSRSSRVDLSAVVLLDPHLAIAKVGDNGMLDIAGSLTMQPVPVNFELLYQGVQNSWQLFGISVSTDPAPTAAATPAAGAKPTGAPATSSGPAAPASAAASSAKSAASTPRQ